MTLVTSYVSKGLRKMELDELGRQKLRKTEFLAADEAWKAIF